MTGALNQRLRPLGHTTAVIPHFGNEETVVVPHTAHDMVSMGIRLVWLVMGARNKFSFSMEMQFGSPHYAHQKAFLP